MSCAHGPVEPQELPRPTAGSSIPSRLGLGTSVPSRRAGGRVEWERRPRGEEGGSQMEDRSMTGKAIVAGPGVVILVLALGLPLVAGEPAEQPRAFIDGTGPGWKPLGGDDFVNVNCDRDTWTFKDG